MQLNDNLSKNQEIWKEKIIDIEERYISFYICAFTFALKGTASSQKFSDFVLLAYSIFVLFLLTQAEKNISLCAP